MYDEYKSKIDFAELTHSVLFEMQTALINKKIAEIQDSINAIKEEGLFVPPQFIKIKEVKIEALTELVIEMTIMTIEKFLQEPESMSYEPEEPDGIE
jgi:hypothetical protein